MPRPCRQLLLTLGSALAIALLNGCPQLLDDHFELFDGVEPDDLYPNSHVPAFDASVDVARDADAGGAGGAPQLPLEPSAGSGGSPETPDAGLPEPDATARDAAPADAAPPPAEDAGNVADPNVLVLQSSLRHRYRFSTGATLVDSVAGADATNMGATFTGGAAVFAGAGQYLDLPNQLLSGLTNATIEVWLVWTVTDPLASSSQWQRIFDFGSNSSAVEGQQGSNANGIFLSPKSGGAQGKLHLEYRSSGNVNLDAPSALPAQIQVQVVVVIDDTSDLLAFYQDGALQGALSFAGSLATITYRNNWLGRSQYSTDPSFQGRLLDFRIYDAALNGAQIQTSLAAGPDADW